MGVAMGVAWTEVGGALTPVEVALMPGKGTLTLTGQLGEVMQESIQAAMTVIRSRASMLGLNSDFQDSIDIHVHVPAGATPKDGPSAGITMALALYSLITNKPVRAGIFACRRGGSVPNLCNSHFKIIHSRI